MNRNVGIRPPVRNVSLLPPILHHYFRGSNVGRYVNEQRFGLMLDA